MNWVKTEDIDCDDIHAFRDTADWQMDGTLPRLPEPGRGWDDPGLELSSQALQ